MTKKVKYIFYKTGDRVEHGRDDRGRALNKHTTFDELPVNLKEKLAVLMTYPDESNYDSEEGRVGDIYWGYVDGDD